MRKLVMILILFLCFDSVCAATCKNRIKTFYVAYLSNFLHDDSRNAALCETYLTGALIDKVGRLTRATGGDPIIRAQDTTEDAIETLSVEALGDDWYLVGYFGKKGDGNTWVEIPLKAQDVGGHCKITYITPVWNGNRYGDELLAGQDAGIGEIDQTSGPAFLKSFYGVYVSAYCGMPEELNSVLASLRLQHLSPSTLKQFENAESESLGDGLAGYDLLIDHFDFDCLWRASIEFTHLNDTNYQITYRGADAVHRLVVTIKKNDENYLIDGILIK